MDSILERRSIRKYTDQPVSDELIRKILEAGMYAPSAHNQQPWEFIVINKKDILKKLSEQYMYHAMLKDAPIGIVICGNTQKLKSPGFWPIDCSAAVENMLIKVQELGLGSVWLGVYPNEERVKNIREIITLPEYIIPFAMMPVGYPAETKPFPQRFDEAKMHINQW